MPIDATQRRVAFSVMAVILLVALAAAPFAHLPVRHIDSFVPVLQTAICILHLVTAVLLFSQYSIWPRFAMLALSSGYVFSGLFAFTQSLAYPGAYSAGVVLGDADTAVWLFVLWQTTFPSAVIVYALTKDTKDVAPSTRPPKVAICIAVACVVAAVAGMTWLLLIGSDFLPKIFSAGGQNRATTIYFLNIYLWLLSSIALALLFLRRRTILDLWLIVTLFAWWPLFLVPMYFTMVRFSIGWYVARSLATLTSSALLVVLLSEITRLYARLASAILLSRRERAERLASVEAATSAMAHEIRQPLAGIAAIGGAGLNWLKAKPANIERAGTCFTAMIDASHRADEIISSIGRLFRKSPSKRTGLRLHDVCREVLKLVQHEIFTNRISVRLRCQQDVPLIDADYTQLQQVILNLVRNAIDAMGSRPAEERRLRLWIGFDREKSVVSLCVRDSGHGISDDDREHIFEPFYTRKANGTGLGLAICRTIIEEHEGTLRLAETHAHGSMFEIVLPVRGPHPDSAATQ